MAVKNSQDPKEKQNGKETAYLSKTRPEGGLGSHHPGDVRLPGDYNDFQEAQEAAENAGGFVAWIDGAYQVRFGAYTTKEQAQAALDTLGEGTVVGTSAYAVIDRNQPSFTEEEYTTDSDEYYSELDSLGRCGVAEACVGVDLMPTEERESISKVKPTGWVQHQYDFVDGGSLYNRCHLIGFQLTGENANEKNLITGTRYMNVEGMLPFENQVADYVASTGNHVLYRVTPAFAGTELVRKAILYRAQ